MPKKLDEDVLLDILGNRTRRRILILLAERPRFVSELSEITGIQRKAIIEHLNLLENYGIVRSITKRLEKGRPRKYYEINRTLFVKIALTRDSLTIRRISGEKVTEEIEKLEEEIERLESEGEEDIRLAASYIVSKIERRIREIEEEWVKFHELLERARRLFLI